MKKKDPEAWRQDFPVDWAADHYVSRRDLVKFLVLVSGGFATGQLCIGLDQLLQSEPGQGFPRLRLCSLDELAVGQSKTFHYPDENEPCLLVRLEENRWVAFHQKCTHLACAVVPQPDQKRFFCPCHEGAFDIESGRPIQGPPRRALPSVTLEITDREVFAIGLRRSNG
ncbi:hypothetical protein ABS71_01015 [bacterium SCN 62-11]|nr:MAG: hypothetical protein ABS71_01015 [bacterium SCN 62-11]